MEQLRGEVEPLSCKRAIQAESMAFEEEAQPESVKMGEDRVEIIWRRRSFPTVPPTPDTVWKEIYKVKNGKLVLVETTPGEHYPAHWVPERIVFKETARHFFIHSNKPE